MVQKQINNTMITLLGDYIDRENKRGLTYLVGVGQDVNEQVDHIHNSHYYQGHDSPYFHLKLNQQ